MPRTIASGFDLFHSNLMPSDSQSAAASSHRASIEASIKSKYTLHYFYRSGSFGNGTSIKYYSDVDYMAIVSNSQLKSNSYTSLRELADTLDTTFPGTGVRVSSPAVVVPFGTLGSETTEVVLGWHIETIKDGEFVYGIADRKQGWMKTSPSAHNKYVTDVNKQHNFMAKPLIRFIKAWNFYSNAGISSFYLEMRVAQYLSVEKSVDYVIDIHHFLKYLHTNNLPLLQDPKVISGYISHGLTDTQKEAAMSRLSTAVARASLAQDAYLDSSNPDSTKNTFYWLDKLFFGKFPGYYF